MAESSARPILMIRAIASRLGTGSVPGCPRHTGQVCVLGGAPNTLAHEQNILVAVESSTWHSRPITASYAIALTRPRAAPAGAGRARGPTRARVRRGRASARPAQV